VKSFFKRNKKNKIVLNEQELNEFESSKGIPAVYFNTINKINISDSLKQCRQELATMKQQVETFSKDLGI
jgi:hypothetical protein